MIFVVLTLFVMAVGKFDESFSHISIIKNFFGEKFREILSVNNPK